MRKLIVLLLLINTCLVCLAQRQVMRQYTMEDGLPGSHTYKVIQDHKGYIWVCTDRGIAKFNGQEFKIFDVNNGLKSNDVWSIDKDQKGRIWLSSFAGLCYIENDSVKHIETQVDRRGKITNHRINKKTGLHLFSMSNQLFLLDDQDSVINLAIKEDDNWFTVTDYYTIGTENKTTVKLFDRYRAKHRVNDRSIPLIYLQGDIFPDPERKLHQYFREKALNFDVNFGVLSNDDATRFLVYKDNQSWLIDGDANELQLSGPLANLKINRVIKLSDQYHLIVGRNQQVVVDQSLKVVDKFSYLVNLNLNYATIDNRQNIWVTTSDGLYFVSSIDQGDKIYELPDKNQFQRINSMTSDKKGRIWIGSSKGNLYLLDTLAIEMVIPGFLDFSFSVLEISKENYLMCGGDFLYQFDVNDLVEKNEKIDFEQAKVLKSNGLKVRNIKSVYCKNDGGIIASTHAELFENNRSATNEVKMVGKHFSYIYSITEDDRGSYWLGSKFGLYHYHQDEGLILHDSKQTLIEEPISNLSFFQKKLWIALDANGLYSYNTLTEQVDTIHELGNELIKDIKVQEDESCLWLATSLGIRKLTILSHKPFQYQLSKINFNQDQVDQEFKSIILQGNSLFAASNNNVIKIDIPSTDELPQQGPFYFGDVKINNQPQKILPEYNLDYDQNNINLSFACLAYERINEIEYKYRLTPLEKEWTYSRNGEASYLALPPGDYTFEIQTNTLTGISLVDSPQQINFVISRPWWLTWYSILAMILFVGLVSYIVLKIRIKQVKRIAAEKTAYQKQFAELELRVLQAQMNPHFLFNALHSIQDFIFEKDVYEANLYLVKFSRLMRLFLESSKEKQISLADELELITLYIELEKLRFEDKFEFEIKVDPNLQTKKVFIPSMLIQPFIENAINHGLYYLNENGKLIIDFEQSHKELHCKIQDNGIGRAKAAAIKANSARRYQSRGIGLIREKLEAWKYYHQSSISIKIVDLVDAHGEAAGTQVNIDIPIDNKMIYE